MITHTTPLAALLVVLATSGPALALEEIDDFGPDPGSLRMYLHMPAVPAENAGVVVALHGCNQSAATYDKTGWTALADEWGFYVVFAEQSIFNNAASCFNWWGEPFSEDNLIRGEGENQSIASMVQHMLDNYAVDDSRIFVTGVSSGGAMVAVMLATWPDLFAAGASIAGIPYRCATTYAGALLCMTPGVNEEPADWGDRVRGAFPEFPGPWPRLMVWQGSSDIVVSPSNYQELVEQWTNVHGIDAAADSTKDLDGYEHRLYTNDAGDVLVEGVYLDSVTHGVPIDPDNGCGEDGAFFPDADTCSTRHIATFFGLAPAGPAPVEPVLPVEESGDAAPAPEAAPVVEEAPVPDSSVSEADAGALPLTDLGPGPAVEPGPSDTGTPSGGCTASHGSAPSAVLLLALFGLLAHVARRRRQGP